MNTQVLQTALCALKRCTRILRVEDMKYDPQFDDYYCCADHQTEAQENRLVAIWDFEDVLYGWKTR